MPGYWNPGSLKNSFASTMLASYAPGRATGYYAVPAGLLALAESGSKTFPAWFDIVAVCYPLSLESSVFIAVPFRGVDWLTGMVAEKGGASRISGK